MGLAEIALYVAVAALGVAAMVVRLSYDLHERIVLLGELVELARTEARAANRAAQEVSRQLTSAEAGARAANVLRPESGEGTVDPVRLLEYRQRYRQSQQSLADADRKIEVVD